MNFSEKLVKLRKENKMSQEDLAASLDVSRQSVSKWESGQTYPEMDKLLAICKIFNVTLDSLTNDEVDINNTENKDKNVIDSFFSFVKNTYNSISREFFLRFIYNQTTELLMNIIEEKSKNLEVKKEDKKFIANFYKYGFVGIVQDWIENGMKENPNSIIKKLNSIIDGNFESALENLDKMHKM